MDENRSLPQGRRNKSKVKSKNEKSVLRQILLTFYFSPFTSLSASLRLCGVIILSTVGIFAQAPTVEKVEPPNWWAASTINPVRILIRGANLIGARAESLIAGISVANVAI